MSLRSVSLLVVLAAIGAVSVIHSPKQISTSAPVTADAASQAAPQADAQPLFAPSPAQRRELVQAYGNLPLSFEPNQGQTDPAVDFIARSAGYELFLTHTEAVMLIGSPAFAGRGPGSPARRSEASVIRFKLAGSNPNPGVSASGKLEGSSNYFIGKDPARWRTNIPSFSRVGYQGIYPGVDLVYYGNQGRLEHDFVVAAGADPRQVRMTVEGATMVRPDGTNGVTLALANSQLHLLKPFAYQQVAGIRHEVSARYRVDGTHLAFEVGPYDHNQPLVIDPVVSYLSYLGGSNDDAQSSISISLDSAGNVYVATGTLSTDFPVTAGVVQPTYGGSPSVCSQNATNICGDTAITKINRAGSAILYSTYLGGSSGEYPFGLAVDSAGNAYVSGYTESTDFPVTKGAYQTTFAGRSATCPPPYFPCGDGFITKINPSGSQLVYSTYLGGSGDDYIENMAIDKAGNAFVTGTTDSSDFPVTAGAFQTTIPCTFSACGVAFVTKLNPSGSALQYSTYLGGSAGSSGTGIAVDGSGNTYVGGNTSSPDFPVTSGAYQKALTVGLCGTPPSYQCPDIFFSKLNFSGSKLLYSSYLGGKGWDTIYGLTLDNSNNVYMAGFTASSDFPTTAGAYKTTFGGGTCNAWYSVSCSDAIVVKFNASKAGPASLVYSTYYGGNREDQAASVAVNASGNAFVTGWTFSNPNAIGGDAFVIEFDSTGAHLLATQLVGGSGFDRGDAIAVDSANNAYIAGSTESTDLPTTPGVFQPQFGGGPEDCFVAKVKGF
jgi:hypothetical protein